MLLVIDNYDSFTYNLVQYLEQIDVQTIVKRNDEISIDEIQLMAPDAIVLSPGPGRPDEAGVCLDVVKNFSGVIPMLGVCLGHQTIAQAFGAKIVSARRIMHGKTSDILSDGKGVFAGLPNPFKAMRYHSLAVDPDSLPSQLIVTAHADDTEIMGIRHVEHETYGVQFHPESIMTLAGKKLLKNFMNLAVKAKSNV